MRVEEWEAFAIFFFHSSGFCGLLRDVWCRITTMSFLSLERVEARWIRSQKLPRALGEDLPVYSWDALWVFLFCFGGFFFTFTHRWRTGWDPGFAFWSKDSADMASTCTERRRKADSSSAQWSLAPLLTWPGSGRGIDWWRWTGRMWKKKVIIRRVTNCTLRDIFT